MNNQELASKAKEIMAINKSINRTTLAKQLGVYRGKVDALEKAGLLVLPAKLSRSMSATIGRKKNKSLNNFYINKKAPWQIGA